MFRARRSKLAFVFVFCKSKRVAGFLHILEAATWVWRVGAEKVHNEMRNEKKTDNMMYCFGLSSASF